jgi:hypothetical protein
MHQHSALKVIHILHEHYISNQNKHNYTSVKLLQNILKLAEKLPQPVIQTDFQIEEKL